MLEYAIHPITYRGEEILATVVKLVPKTTTKIHPYIPVLYINYIFCKKEGHCKTQQP